MQKCGRTMVVGWLALSAGIGCNDHIFQVVAPIRTRTVVTAKQIDIDRAADILFVIDNSGSMAEEQENLARNISSSGVSGSGCETAQFAALKDFFERDGRDLPEEEWPAEMQVIHRHCGFIERLQLHDNRFHLGVITTDLNDCDCFSNVEHLADCGCDPAVQPACLRAESWPQRGCLQTGPEEPELAVLTWETPDLASRFASIVRNLGTRGSPYEQGLEAARHFLTPGHSVPPRDACGLTRDCAGDRDAFLRETEVNAVGDEVPTKLVVIFLTDEEDCSHDGSLNEAETPPALCYQQPSKLRPVADYIEFLRQAKPRPDLVSAAVIGGFTDQDGLAPTGCSLTPSGPTSSCSPSGGNSFMAQYEHCAHSRHVDATDTCEPNCVCHPAFTEDTEGPCQGVSFEATNCCEADPPTRYSQLVSGIQSHLTDTICSADYSDTLINIADLVNQTSWVRLAEPPPVGAIIVVKIRGPRWGEAWVAVPGASDDSDGWMLREDGTTIDFSGAWIPRAGDEVEVMFEGA